MKSTLVMGFMGIGVMAASSAQATTTRYLLLDHPDGALRAPLYGLRLDNFFGDGRPVTFSFEEGGARMLMNVTTDDSGHSTIHIHGTMFGGADDVNSTTWLDPQLYNIDFTYRDGVRVRGDSFEVTDSPNNTGVISSGNHLLDVGDVFGTSFYFRPDSYRIPSGGDTLVGRGWLQMDGQPRVGYQDWLFTGQAIIPLPSTAALAGLGLAGIAGLRRRRTV